MTKSLREFLTEKTDDTVELNFAADGHSLVQELEDRGIRIVEFVEGRNESTVTISKDDLYKANQILKMINSDVITEDEKVDEADVDRLEEIRDEIKELIGEAEEIIRGSYEYRAAKAYWIPHILTALDDESEYMGKSMTTMQDTIENLKNPGASHEEYDDEADRDN